MPSLYIAFSECSRRGWFTFYTDRVVSFFWCPWREFRSRAVYRAGCASFRQSRKPDEADAVFNFNKALPMIYAVTVHNVFRVFPEGKPHKTQTEPIKSACVFYKILIAGQNCSSFYLVWKISMGNFCPDGGGGIMFSAETAEKLVWRRRKKNCCVKRKTPKH